jgi:hypothetical protein
MFKNVEDPKADETFRFAIAISLIVFFIITLTLSYEIAQYI